MRERNLNSELVGEIAAEIMHVSRQLVQRGVRAMGNLDIGIGQLPVLKLLSDNGAMTQPSDPARSAPCGPPGP